jgi:hypothetical protein
MASGDVEIDGDLANKADAAARRRGEKDLRAVVERLLREYLAEPEGEPEHPR